MTRGPANGTTAEDIHHKRSVWRSAAHKKSNKVKLFWVNGRSESVYCIVGPGSLVEGDDRSPMLEDEGGRERVSASDSGGLGRMSAGKPPPPASSCSSCGSRRRPSLQRTQGHPNTSFCQHQSICRKELGTLLAVL